MPSDKQSYPNQQKHWYECTDSFDEESDDGDEELDDAATEQGSGDESVTNYVVTESTSVEKSPKRRSRRERRWKTEEPRIRKLPLANTFDNDMIEKDKLAEIRYLWMVFLAQLRLCYIPDASLTVDEQLVPTRSCCDSSTAYPLKGAAYVGRHLVKTAATNNMNCMSNLVKRPLYSWINTGRIISTDNCFTSAELAEDLLGAQITFVGAMRRNKKEIPSQI
ncbi:unnamed protein product [Rotaria magnacalcarata]|nr:unnamed protein product [Rotaria magnacalcarata]